jgi:YD repeat-containing protein
MDWEERNFSGLGSTLYRLSYGYNLAGNLTSLTEPSQFGASVSYGYDTAGRLNSVTGSGLAGGVSQLASNIQYRAWGDLREMNYGNGLRRNQGYNSNMLVSNYEVKVPGTPVGEGERARSGYQYEADGRIFQMTDFTDGNFNRSYLYDHVGRLIDADTGSPAYFQSFTYDEFDHLTGRSNGSWRHNDWTVSQWQNNRNTSTTVFPPSHPACCPPQPVFWTYSADGEVTHDHNKEYTYDAAGNNIRVFETTDIGTSLVNKLWIFQDYDSDGNRVKRVEQSQVNLGPFTFVTTYFLRSSVLDDAVVIELDQNGGKRRAFIFADGDALAQQENNQVRWVHVDPVTSSLRETATDGTLANRIETDPMGNGVSLTDPAPPEEPTPDYLYPGTYEGTGNPYDGPSGCTLDGQPLPCSFVLGFVNIGAAAQCPDNRCGPRHNGRGWEFWDPDRGWQKRGQEKPPTLKKPGSKQKPKGKPKPKPKPKPEPPKKPGPKPDTEPPEPTGASSDGQLSPCLRNALRQFFPAMTAQGQTFSPVDDARFKNWIPERFRHAAKLPGVVNPAAITLGLYDIHYDPLTVNISGGGVKSLNTVIEEVAHTVQFTQVWAGLKRGPILEKVGVNTTGYGAAKRRWASHYVYHAAKSGFSYDNAVEKWAKDRTAEILTSLRTTARARNQWELCGFRLF